MSIFKLIMILATTNELLRHVNLLLYNYRRFKQNSDPNQHPPYNEVFNYETDFRRPHTTGRTGHSSVPTTHQARAVFRSGAFVDRCSDKLRHARNRFTRTSDGDGTGER